MISIAYSKPTPTLEALLTIVMKKFNRKGNTVRIHTLQPQQQQFNTHKVPADSFTRNAKEKFQHVMAILMRREKKIFLPL